jgi:rSAM/selenodomain-associated transferase 2
VLNEAALVRPFLDQTRSVAPDAEVIVVDGGSNDGTPELAAPLSDRVVQASRGRAKQMNAGAAVARGEILWFVHVDSELPAGAPDEIRRCLTETKMVGGCFRLEVPRGEWIYRVTDKLGNIGVDLFRIALGDHGIFCRRAAFEQIGGYSELPLLEDAEFYQKLRNAGRVKQLRASIRTSPRTFERLGRYRTTAVYAVILALYVAGVPIPDIHNAYLRLVARR